MTARRIWLPPNPERPLHPTPPIWQGRAREGESAAILGRNPDGTFQVSLNGVEKTFTEPNLAGMLDMRKGPLYEMLGQATQQQLAQPRTNSSTPPIWQGRAAHGESAAILGRNPDGTFQVSLTGVEKTFKEPQVAAMTRLKKGPLYEMLGQATQKQRNQAQPENREMLESRWAPKVIPKGVSPEAVAEWRRHLESKRVANPVQVSELVHWQESGLEEGQSLAGEKVIERSVQSMLDLIPREVIERLGKLKLATVPSIPGGVMARFNPNTNTIEINSTLVNSEI